MPLRMPQKGQCKKRQKQQAIYNPGQNIWYKVEKSSKVGQDFKSLLSNLRVF